MILNNYWKWLGTVQKHADANGSNFDYGIKNISGTSISMYMSASGDYTKNNTLFAYGLYAMIGSSTTEPDPTDYTIADDIDLEVSCSLTYEMNDSLKKTFVVTGTNTTNASITITQVGICKEIKGTNGTPADIMVAVAVLSTPLTVPAGDGFTILFDWEES